MKTNLLTAIGLAVVSGFSLGAQTVEEPSTFANVYIGAGGGVVTPMHNHPFFGAMRGSAGVFIGKQLTPTFGPIGQSYLRVHGLYGLRILQDVSEILCLMLLKEKVIL